MIASGWSLWCAATSEKGHDAAGSIRKRTISWHRRSCIMSLKKTKDQGDRLYPLRLRVGTFLHEGSCSVQKEYPRRSVVYPSCDVRGDICRISRRCPTMWDLIGKSTDMDATQFISSGPRHSPFFHDHHSSSTLPIPPNTLKKNAKGETMMRGACSCGRHTTRQEGNDAPGTRGHAACDVRLFHGRELVNAVGVDVGVGVGHRPSF